MANVITPKIFRSVCYQPGDVVLRFLNDLGGIDLVHFPGNGSRSFQSAINETTLKRVTDFATETGREEVLKITAGEKLQFSRQFPNDEIEGVEQLLSSRLVQCYYRGKWYDVQLAQKDWKDRVKDNAFMVTVEIKLPERFIND